ncbi:hypothetical protein [Shewanella sp.]|uniref:hypothetical protein n=1 Tax=Shewanella sp. TaxID=50422 RepID=UPI003564A2A6
MADNIDRANEITEQLKERQIKAARENTSLAKATGYCLNCSEKLNDSRRWCDPNCRDDWEKLGIR